MTGNWKEERDREWREARRRREDYGRGDQGRDYGGESYSRGEERSFRPEREPARERDRAFGQRETGPGYAGPRYYGDEERYDYEQGGDDRAASDPAALRGYGGERGGHYGPERGRSFWGRASGQVSSWFGDREAERRRDWEGRPEARSVGHRGRGPEGYKRSDERIREEVHDRLTEDPWVDASKITVSVSGGEVTLAGTVAEREAKHRAERIIEDLSGVEHVQNNLRVDRGSFFTRPAAGFGDSAQAAQMKLDEASPTSTEASNHGGGAKGSSGTTS